MYRNNHSFQAPRMLNNSEQVRLLGNNSHMNKTTLMYTCLLSQLGCYAHLFSSLDNFGNLNRIARCAIRFGWYLK